MLLSNEYTLIPHIKITLKYDDGIVQHHILKEDDIIICKYRENTKISTINGKITKIGYKLNSSFTVINRTIYLQIDGSDKHAGHVVYVNIDDIVGIKVLKTGSMISNPVCTVANEDQAVCMLRENENGQLEYSKDGLEWKTVGAVLPTKPEHKEEEKPVVDEHSATGGEANEKREENSERENSGKYTTVESNSGNVSENNQGHVVSPVVENDNKVDSETKPPVEEKHEDTPAHVDESHNTVEETHTESPSVTTEDHHADTSLQPQPSTDDHSVNTEDTSHNTVEEKHEDIPTNVVARSEDGKHEETTHTTSETDHTESSSVTTEDHHDETRLQPPASDTTHTETNSVVNSETHTEPSTVVEGTHTATETHDESGLHNEEGLIKPPENHTEENTHHEEANRVIDNGIHEEQPVASVPQPVIDGGIHTEPVTANPVNNDHNSETTIPIATEGVTGSSSEDGAARTNDIHVEPREDSQ